mgnify:FL=1
MKKLMCLVTVLMMISMFAFSINSFSADEVDNQDTYIVTNENNAENYGEYKVLLTDDIEGDATVDEATDDEMAYSSGNPAPKGATSDEVGSEMSSPQTSDADTYTAVVLALLFGSVASVAVYKLKK